MNHDEAVRIYAAEGYLVQDLTSTERDAFEEHMFSCLVCADQVKFIRRLFDSLQSDPEFDSRFHTPHAAAAYLLGDLVGDKRKVFEEHLLTCRLCAQHVKLGKDIFHTFQRAMEGDILPGTRLVAALRFCRWFHVVFSE